jgi:hypothetical protein
VIDGDEKSGMTNKVTSIGTYFGCNLKLGIEGDLTNLGK